MGLGVPTIKATLEENKIDYLIFPHGSKPSITSSEIVISHIPARFYDDLAYYKLHSTYEATGITAEAVLNSYHEIIKIAQPVIPVRIHKKPITKESKLLSNEENADLYYGRRLTNRQFESMKDGLVSWATVSKAARERGYSKHAIEVATDIRFKLPRECWNPYVYRTARYYDKDILNHLSDIDATYVTKFFREKNQARRAEIAREKKVAVQTVSGR